MLVVLFLIGHQVDRCQRTDAWSDILKLVDLVPPTAVVLHNVKDDELFADDRSACLPMIESL